MNRREQQPKDNNKYYAFHASDKMSRKYFIFSIRRPAAPSLCAALVLIAFGLLVSPSNGIPVALPDETSSSTTTTAASTTVKILIPPSSGSDDGQDDDDDAIISKLLSIL